MREIEYKIISPDRDDVAVLMNKLNEHHLSLVETGICHLTTADELARVKSIMIGAFADERLCGIGAIKLFNDYAEVTRMFVREDCRGLGIARRILEILVQQAISCGINTVQLETSEKFVSAVRLYESFGFSRCAPFGEHVQAPYNTYMRLTI